MTRTGTRRPRGILDRRSRRGGRRRVDGPARHPHVDLAVTGEDGVFAQAEPGALWIDSSTIRPDASVRLPSIGRDNGIRALDAPLSGGEVGAIDGTLSVMVGGDADFEAAKPVLNAVGSTIVHVGPSDAGQVVKAANQLLVAGTLGLVAEAQGSRRDRKAIRERQPLHEALGTTPFCRSSAHFPREMEERND
jgi:3-hydroxyisobutyrate dehydrogenase-like beta-hydroxyacid dehydrogenase